jgi:curved DNA-binding protein CbpA
MPQIAANFLVLELDSCESARELKSAYNRLIKKWHPDLFYNDPAMVPVATEHAKRINGAYEFLSELFERGALPLSTPRPRGSHRSASAPAQQPPSAASQEQFYRTQHTYKGRKFSTGFPDPTVFEVFVKSSHIVSIGYNRAERILYIKFEGGDVYSYQEVPESVFEDFLAAESHGKFANRFIFHKYKSFRY